MPEGSESTTASSLFSKMNQPQWWLAIGAIGLAFLALTYLPIWLDLPDSPCKECKELLSLVRQHGATVHAFAQTVNADPTDANAAIALQEAVGDFLQLRDRYFDCIDTCVPPGEKDEAILNAIDDIYLPVWGGKAASREPVGRFELLDVPGYREFAGLSPGKPVHIIVASDGTPDVRASLPILLEIEVSGRIVWHGIIMGDPAEVCRGETGCSMDGPAIQPEWLREGLQLRAHSFSGGLLAVYEQAKDGGGTANQ